MSRLLVLFVLITTTTVLSQNAREIVQNSDIRLRGSSSYAEVSITIVRPKWQKEMNLKSWSKGSDYSVTLVTSPAKEKGSVFLKRKREAWNYLPVIERTIKLPPSMMTQNWMGTDFTNDDLVQRSSVSEDYKNKIIGEDNIDGYDCWIIELIPNQDAPVVWGKLIMWIDKKDYMQLKTQFFDEYDEMVSVMTSNTIKNFGGKNLPAVIEFIPLDKEGNKTVIERLVWEFDIEINERFFLPNYMKNLR